MPSNILPSRSETNPRTTEEVATMSQIIDQVLENFSKSAPEILTRQKIHELTGGLISAKTLANRDALNIGIQPRLRIAGKVCYSKAAVIEFLKNRSETF